MARPSQSRFGGVWNGAVTKTSPDPGIVYNKGAEFRRASQVPVTLVDTTPMKCTCDQPGCPNERGDLCDMAAQRGRR